MPPTHQRTILTRSRSDLNQVDQEKLHQYLFSCPAASGCYVSPTEICNESTVSETQKLGNSVESRKMYKMQAIYWDDAVEIVSYGLLQYSLTIRCHCETAKSSAVRFRDFLSHCTSQTKAIAVTNRTETCSSIISHIGVGALDPKSTVIA